MSLLPSADTPLNQHSLAAIELWWQGMGAEQSKNDLSKWVWTSKDWTAEILIEYDELRVVWQKTSSQKQCSFPYGLSRRDVEAAMNEGP